MRRRSTDASPNNFNDANCTARERFNLTYWSTCGSIRACVVRAWLSGLLPADLAL
jgi:hypothetical protein